MDHPVSLYAATKRSAELISESYAHLFGLPQTGLRFFTVYGPWGRPDMAPWMFAEAILSGRPVTLYDGGRLKRDFTFVDDIAAGVLGCLDHPAEGRCAAAAEYRQPPQRRGSAVRRGSGGRAGPARRGGGYAAACDRCRSNTLPIRGHRGADRGRPRDHRSPNTPRRAGGTLRG